MQFNLLNRSGVAARIEFAENGRSCGKIIKDKEIRIKRKMRKTEKEKQRKKERE